MIFKIIGFGVGAAVCVIVIRKWRERIWGVCRSPKSMENRTVIITGANSGIGKATATELAKLGARVILACRDLSKAQAALNDIRRVTSNGELKALPLDLASLESVRKFAKLFCATENKLDVLINNAGIFQCPYELTKDKFEMQFGVNHLGHFLLTSLLLDELKKSVPSRIVIVTSSLYEKGELHFDNLNSDVTYDKQKAYYNSKLANVMFCTELSKHLKGTGVNVYAVSPGMVWTNLGRHIRLSWVKMAFLIPLAWLFIRTPYQGCQTVLYCAVSDEVSNESGHLYRNCGKIPIKENALDEDVAARLWAVSEELTHSLEKN